MFEGHDIKFVKAKSIRWLGPVEETSEKGMRDYSPDEGRDDQVHDGWICRGDGVRGWRGKI
jgi:hypothetical protein